MKTYDLLRESAVKIQHRQRKDGSMPAGKNGVYSHDNTPVPDTAKGSCLFLKAYSVSSETEFLKSAKQALNYLLESDCCPNRFTYKCRKQGRDKANGLIGPRQVIHAFSLGYAYTENSSYLDEAKRLYDIIPFNQKRNLWERVEINGKNIGIDNTINHQLSFASSLKYLRNYPLIEKDVKYFLDNLSYNLSVRPNGRIKHLARPPNIWIKTFYGLLNLYHWSQGKHFRKKEPGYHAYNVYCLLQLKKMCPNHHLWQSEIFQNIKTYFFSKTYENHVLGSNKYSENAKFYLSYALILTGESYEKGKEFLSEYLKDHYSTEDKLLAKNFYHDYRNIYLIQNLADLPCMEISL